MKPRNVIIFILFLAVAAGVILWQVLGIGKPGGLAATPLEPLRISVAYSSETQDWLTAAINDYNGRKVKVGEREVTVSMTRIEDAEAVREIASNAFTPTVWIPSSSLWVNRLNNQWRAGGNASDLILRSGEYQAAPLVLSPIVFVMYQDRADPFLKKYQRADWTTVQQAINEPGGWQAIGGDPNWQTFKLGQVNPRTTNAGLMAVTLATYSYFAGQGQANLNSLTPQQLRDKAYNDWLISLERGVVEFDTDARNLMNSMITRGSSQYDVVAVPENLAATQMKNAADLRVFYPSINIWSDHPFGILQAGSTAEQKDAALNFQEFLYSEAQQRAGLKYGFRPANPDVPVVTDDPDNLFKKYASQGLQARPAGSRVAAVPSGEITQAIDDVLGAVVDAAGNKR